MRNSQIFVSVFKLILMILAVAAFYSGFAVLAVWSTWASFVKHPIVGGLALVMNSAIIYLIASHIKIPDNLE